jgi:hypothetical protein
VGANPNPAVFIPSDKLVEKQQKKREKKEINAYGFLKYNKFSP